MRALADACAVPFDGLWLDAPATVPRERVALHRDDVSDARVSVLDKQLALDVRIPDDWHRVDAGREPRQMLQGALTALGIQSEVRTEDDQVVSDRRKAQARKIRQYL